MTRQPSSLRSGPIRIGCAGWSIPSRHAHLFGEGESHLARYATRFDVVEINSTFYRSHLSRTYERWAGSVPRAFRFSVKMPRHITHEARLLKTGDALSTFFDEIAGLGQKLGGVLVQLPPSLALDRRAAARFFALLRRRSDVPVACEPRHPSWFEASAARLWQEYSIARVAADPAGVPAAAGPAAPIAGVRWSYWRWHGSPRMYYSCYEDEALRALAAELRAHGRARVPAWCILDNTAQGHAIDDAARLQALCREAG